MRSLLPLAGTARDPSTATARIVDWAGVLGMLEQIGFVQVGEWRIDRNLKSQVRFHLTAFQDTRAIYAYLVGGSLKYIGVCHTTNTTLGKRLARYQNMTGGGTNERIAGLIRAALLGGETVAIYGWAPPKKMTYNGLPIDLVNGLENPLIALLRPEWNRQS